MAPPERSLKKRLSLGSGWRRPRCILPAPHADFRKSGPSRFPSPLICVRSARASTCPIPPTHMTRKRSPELEQSAQTKTTVSGCGLRTGRGQPAQRPTIPQNGAILKRQAPGRAHAGWRMTTRAHMLDTRLNRPGPSVKVFAGVWREKSAKHRQTLTPRRRRAPLRARAGTRPNRTPGTAGSAGSDPGCPATGPGHAVRRTRRR